MFQLSPDRIDTERLKEGIRDAHCGAFASFEGWVRNNSEGQEVLRLDYEAYEELAQMEGQRIMAEAVEQFSLVRAFCVHRIGSLDLGDTAVWIGVSAPHRREALEAVSFIIEQIKKRLPIWKQEHYKNGKSGWVNCQCLTSTTGGAHA